MIVVIFKYQVVRRTANIANYYNSPKVDRFPVRYVEFAKQEVQLPHQAG